MSNVVSADNISKSFGESVLFSNLNIGLSQGDRVALIGPNGTGKTTLLEILACIEMPDTGKVSIRKDIKVGYLEQQPEFPAGMTVSQSIFSADTPIMQLLSRYERLMALNRPEDVNELSDIIHKIDDLDGWKMEDKVNETLGKLGIYDLDKEVNELSGGQKRRVALAALLIDAPDLLFLDEPTNHLDLDTIEWLEKVITQNNITLLMTTHDRYFLDSVSTQIWEFSNKQLFQFKGNYAYYLEKKSEREDQQQSTLEKNLNTYKIELEWMRRQPKARGTKSRSRIDSFGNLENQVKGVKKQQAIQLNFKSEHLGTKIVELHKITKSYGERQILQPFSYTFKRGERLGVVGKNGSGKSTLLNIISGGLAPDTGKVVLGETLSIGYYQQGGLNFTDDDKVFDVISNIADNIEMDNGVKLPVSQFLTRFLFPPQKQHTYVRKLSGGEKRRLQLLTILVKKPNFLILDEPTNDLDLMTLNVLEDYLASFKGCLVIVSHDRYFLDRLVDHLFICKPNEEIKDFPGNYTDYREWLTENQVVSSKAKSENKPSQNMLATKPLPATTKAKLSFKEQKEYETLGAEIPLLEAKKAEILEKMNGGSLSHQELQDISVAFEKIATEIDEKTFRWLELSELA